MDAGMPPPGNGSGEAGKQLSRVACPHCGHVLEFSGLRPLFCGFCGKRLTGITQETTVVPSTGPEAPTVAPFLSTSVEVEQAAQVVGGYRLLRRLGSGGMGTVYEAEDGSGRRVALKLIAGGQAASDDTLERFRREGRLASAIAHPRCVFVLAADEDAGRPYIVMELMPGETLADVLRRRGGLPPAEAVAKIIDVLDGLREAHRLGVVHRDIKPSNCFVDVNGRVKVGDFGLSKSLMGESNLTQSGSFLGTPLFASPEQVRGEALGPQSDVYSLAATLYCLLTGRAPFEGGDAAATLARIAADAVPPMRTLREELSPALDRVVLRGLERDRRRRWRDLDEFKEALLPFVPGRQEAAGRSIRFAAFLVDVVFLYILGILWALVAFATGEIALDPTPSAIQRQALRQLEVISLLWFVYFVISERLWGCTLGKWLLNLRVCVSPGRDIPGWGRVAVRFAVFYVLLSLEQIAVLPWLGSLDFESNGGQVQVRSLMITLRPIQFLGVGLLLSTVRRRNGWRGLHEFASGTCVIQLPEMFHRRARAVLPLGGDFKHAKDLPERTGPFDVRGVLRWDDEVRVLLGEDRALGRLVLLWLRPVTEEPLNAASRSCARATRLRWLANGRQDDLQWDAFPAPAGSLLADLVNTGGPLQWPEVRPILEQLTEELTAASADGTLIGPLRVGRVWAQPDGCLLLDMSLRREEVEPESADLRPPALALLARTAALALEGPHSRDPMHISATVPEHATRLVDRLLGGKKAFRNLGEFRAELEATRRLPLEVNRGRRMAHVVVQTALLSIGLLTMFMAGWLSGLPALITLRETRNEGQRVLRQLEIGSAAEFAGDVLALEPFVKCAAAYRSCADGRLCERIQEHLTEEERESHVRIRGANWLTRGLFHWLEGKIDEQSVILPPSKVRVAKTVSPDIQFRSAAEHWVADADALPGKAREESRGFLLVLLIWPGLWVLSAFVFRGGISMPLMGLSLVRSDGRRAGRFRCALRTLLVWLPPTALLAGAVLLETWYWSATRAVSGRGWEPWLAELLRLASVGLLALYPVLAVRSPDRALHDRLAGTCLVPR
jgi:hypothetical protein